MEQNPTNQKKTTRSGSIDFLEFLHMIAMAHRLGGGTLETDGGEVHQNVASSLGNPRCFRGYEDFIDWNISKDEMK